MLYIQLSVILLTGISFILLMRKLLRIFGRQDIAIYFFTPGIAYCVGFAFRLSGIKFLIDLGYFFTDGASLVIYTIFSVTFLIGQLKYWKK